MHMEIHYRYYTLSTETRISLGRRAEKLSLVFDKLDGIHCNSAEAALYIFPRIDLSKAFIEAAQRNKCLPDVFFCKELLRATGIVVVPGSGFGQKEDTFHFRTTILPPEGDIDVRHALFIVIFLLIPLI
jgi:aspartate/methionine/tyrosine aminotransferase